MGEGVARLVADMLSWRRAREPDPLDARLGLAVLERIAARGLVTRAELLALATEVEQGTPAQTDRADRVSGLAELDRQGGVVGIHGLSARPTAYVVALPDGDRGAWCALDTLFLPPLLRREAAVSGRCALTGAPVSLHVSADGVARDPVPASLTVTVPVPDPAAPPRSYAELRRTFCARSRFALDPDAAASLVAEDVNVAVLDLEAAARVGRGIAEGLEARARV